VIDIGFNKKVNLLEGLWWY